MHCMYIKIKEIRVVAIHSYVWNTVSKKDGMSM